MTAGRVPTDPVHRVRCNWSEALVVGSLASRGTREESKYRGNALVAFAACRAIAVAATACVAFVASIVRSLQLCAGIRGFGSFCCGGATRVDPVCPLTATRQQYKILANKQMHSVFGKGTGRRKDYTVRIPGIAAREGPGRHACKAVRDRTCGALSAAPRVDRCGLQSYVRWKLFGLLHATLLLSTSRSVAGEILGGRRGRELREGVFAARILYILLCLHCAAHYFASFDALAFLWRR